MLSVSAVLYKELHQYYVKLWSKPRHHAGYDVHVGSIISQSSALNYFIKGRVLSTGAI